MDKWQQASQVLSAKGHQPPKTRQPLSALEFILGGAFKPLALWEPRDQEANQNSKEIPNGKGKV